jgi:cell surface protein SprA
MIRPKDELMDADMAGGEWGPTNKLMLKNVYSLHPGAASWTEEGLPEASILRDGFEMAIHYKGTVGGAEDPDELEGTKIIRYVGLDSYEETDTGYQLGEDGRVDFGRWIDQGRGLIYFPDLAPFAPESVNELRGRPADDYPWEILPQEFRNPRIYDRKTCVRKRQSPGTDTTWTSRFYLEVKYRTPVTQLQIDAWDIIEGSEVVTVGARRLQKDRDYRIDYQTGIVHLYDETEIGEDEQINITYKQASAFGMVSKSLVGAAARYAPEDSKLSFSTSWLFQRTGSPDRRPRLGSEPTRIAVGEVALGYETESRTLTRLLDRLPLLDTRHPSRLSFSGGVGVSFPNPNTRNDLYVDDFEGVADDIAVRLNRLAWKSSSIPVSSPGDGEADQAAHRGELWWYTPYRALREGDLNPTLDYQEANDYRTVLELQAWPYAGPLDTLGIETCPPESSWVGITQNLARTSLDLTRARFLDIWINDFVNWESFQADTTLRSGTLFVELGRISEDALWERRPVDCQTKQIIGGPIDPPNARLDNEDANNDGQLDLSDANDEDSGLDGVNEEDGPTDEYLDDYGFSGDAETSYASDPEL